MCVPTKRQGDCVCLATIKDSREELYDAWFRVRSWWKIYFAVLVDMAEGIRNTAKRAYDLSSSNGWTKSHVLWAEIGEIRSIGPELVQETTNKLILIKEKLKRLEIVKRAMLAIGEYWTDVNMHVPLEEIKNVGNQNRLIVVPEIANQNGNGNVVAARADGNGNGKIRCYYCRGVGHYARNCTVKPRRMDATYLQTQLLIAQKEETGIQLQAEEFDLMAAAADCEEIKEVNVNCILMANL
ncbi:gag-pol polyprotein [Tanacetum coccineum]